MNDISTIYQYFKRAVAAGETARISVWGNYLTLLSTTGASNIQLSINGQPMQEIPQGLSVKLPGQENFKYIELYNSEAAAVTIELSLSSGEIGDARASASLLTVMQAVRDELKGSAAGLDNAKAAVGVAAVLVLAANTARKAFLVTAPKANTGIIYIGLTAGLTTSKGIAELQAGMSLMLDDYQGTVYAISDTAAQSLYYGEW